MKPDVTIFADASVDPKTGLAGWACWMKGGSAESIVRGAALKKAVTDTTEAELLALANAMHVAQAAALLHGHVMLQSDCAYALGCILKEVKDATQSPVKDGHVVPMRRKKMPPEYLAPIALIDNIRRQTGITIVVRHVRGHQEGDGRNWVNRKCDAVAKRYMRETRKAARAQEVHP